MSIVALFDCSGYSVIPWAELGETCYCLDIKNNETVISYPSGGSVTFLYWDASASDASKFVEDLQPKFIISFPPCTDLAVSGAAHFANKRMRNYNYLNDAMEFVYIAYRIAKKVVPYVIENPISVISKEWRKPDVIFHPYEFGGYLSHDDTHPVWPDYINPRDAYPKKTCFWFGNGFIFPTKKPVLIENGLSKQHLKLGGKSEKTKTIRSQTPRGTFIAICQANYKMVTGKDFK